MTLRRDDVSGLVLAGGRSSRMGVEKALLATAGPGSPTLLERQVDLLRGLELGRVIVSLRRDFPLGADILDSDARDGRRVIVVHDETEDLGPLGGIVSAMRVDPSHYLLVLAVDMPGVDRRVLHSILERAGHGRGVVPLGSAGWEPLCALYPPGALRAAEEALRGPDPSPRGLIEFLVGEGRVLPFPLPASLRYRLKSWNTPGDLPATLPGMSAA